MTLLLDDRAVASLLDPVALVEAIEQALRAESDCPSVVPDRLNLAGTGRFLRIMPAIVPGAGVMGLKTFFGGGTAGVRYFILLASIETGEVLAALDARYLTAARTAATSAVAARAMGIKASSIGLLGSGLEAQAHLRTFAALGSVTQVKVYSRNPERRAAFAARMSDELGLEVTAVDSAFEACQAVQHLITATNTGYHGPIACESAWIPPGIHLTAIGSTHQDLRELDADTLRRSDVLVFDADPAQLAQESGDVRAWLDGGGDLSAAILLGDLLQQTVPVPSRAVDLSIFKSVGTALQDMIAANFAYRAAIQSGLGRALDDFAVPKIR